ncbi:ATP-dependent DNA ligase [Streptomyces albidoflavus]|uniref:ATP-dependent DNA ligase n=1 Tax=Streptomyces albidoflavus TaxID=1886 RepID=UPI0033B4605A
MVLDGELAVLHKGRLDFAALQQRARLGGFRARSVARARPAHVVTFDLLEADGEELLAMPYRER